MSEREIFQEVFGDGEFRYSSIFRMLEIKHIIARSDESVCMTIMKNNYHSSHTWSYTMMDNMDEETIRFMVDTQVLKMIEDICQRILDETKFQKN